MVRRLFRLVLRLSVLGGIGYAVVKVLQRRDDGRALAPAPTWPPVTPSSRPDPLPRAEPSAAPAAPKAVVVPPAPGKAEKVEHAEQATPPPKPAAPKGGQTWVAPSSDGICPSSHPIRAKLTSKLFHLPGMFAYDRTKPDRCYANESDAEADGLRKAKR
jgi:hypothetical protein